MCPWAAGSLLLLGCEQVPKKTNTTHQSARYELRSLSLASRPKDLDRAGSTLRRGEAMTGEPGQPSAVTFGAITDESLLVDV